MDYRTIPLSDFISMRLLLGNYHQIPGHLKWGYQIGMLRHIFEGDLEDE